MIIPCCEKCIYQEDGLCTLTQVTSCSNTPLKDCPYFLSKDHEDSKDNKKDQIEGKYFFKL